MSSFTNPYPPSCNTDQTPAVLQIWGQNSLQGEVPISGSKNAALVIMAAAILSGEDCRIRNVPHLTDIQQLAAILSSLGVRVTHCGSEMEINGSHLSHTSVPAGLASQLRASFFVIGPLLTRFGSANIPLPGGCAIGSRPVDLHIQGLRAMGADVEIQHNIVHARFAAGQQRLQGAHIRLDFPSVGATETLIMAATLAEGETVITNAAREPEIVDLANFCRSMGAKIRGAGSSTIAIAGVSHLHGTDYKIIPDRIEAATFLIAGAITHSPLSLTAVNPFHLQALIQTLRAMGIIVFSEALDRLRIVPIYPQGATNVETGPYPGFPTDMQAPLMALMTLARGQSTLAETIFENRLQHVPELNRMGAMIQVQGNHAHIQGVSKLKGTTVTATDLRASAALVLAALAAEGMTTIQDLHHLNRGYENLIGKLQSLGAVLQRVSTPCAEQETILSSKQLPLSRHSHTNYLDSPEVA